MPLGHPWVGETRTATNEPRGAPVPGAGSPKGTRGSGAGAAQLCSRVVSEENFTMKGSLLKTSVPQGSQPSS